MVGPAEHPKKIYITAGHIQYLQRDHPAGVLEYFCRVNFILTDHHFFLPFMWRQCVVVGPAEQPKKIYITAGHIQYLQRDHPAVVLEYSYRVNFILTDHHFFFAIYAEAMCSGWSGGAS